MSTHTPNEGDLQVWWIPQVPMKSFNTPIQSVEEGVKLLDVLARYDLFQLANNIKPDYCNAGGIAIFEAGEWDDWYCHETGEDDPKAFLAARTALSKAGEA